MGKGIVKDASKVLSVFKGCFKNVSKKFEGSAKSVSRKFQRFFKTFSWKFPGSFGVFWGIEHLNVVPFLSNHKE